MYELCRFGTEDAYLCVEWVVHFYWEKIMSPFLSLEAKLAEMVRSICKNAFERKKVGTLQLFFKKKMINIPAKARA